MKKATNTIFIKSFAFFLHICVQKDNRRQNSLHQRST